MIRCRFTMQFSVSTETPIEPICEGVSRCRANLEHESQSWPDFCPDLCHFQNESLFQLCKLFPPRPLEITRKSRSKLAPASWRGGNHIKRLEDFHLRNGSTQGQYLALIVLYVPSLLDSGYRDTSLVRNTLPLGPCSRTISRVIWWS